MCLRVVCDKAIFNGKAWQAARFKWCVDDDGTLYCNLTCDNVISMREQSVLCRCSFVVC